ncbi:NitT/TauT family transport system permease protein [Selenomonas sp. GACV-9]|uniref:ABC transporter permease n=1 Tax=Selenomonas sp. GACV-9 TaxID=3158782 RepID=UPI0008DEF124|nr:NitT/TauT family transport system permease protein [Selenomonas ruminantium]
MRNGKVVLRAYLGGAVFLLALWWAISLLVELPIIPAPDKVLVKLSHVFMQAIAIHGAYSLWRIAAGLVLAVGIGYPIGLIMGYFPRADRLLAPLVYLTYPIPKIALLPILMLLAGIGEWSKILMIFLIIVFQVIIAVRDGIRAIPEETYYPLYSLGASFGQLFRYVIFPASLPKFITAVRVAMATAISVLFFTETFGTQYGMGYYIMDAWLRVNYLEMYAGIVVLSFLGLLLFGLIDLVEYFACRWQQ